MVVEVLSNTTVTLLCGLPTFPTGSLSVVVWNEYLNNATGCYFPTKDV